MYSLLSIPTSSISAPDRFTFDGIKSTFSTTSLTIVFSTSDCPRIADVFCMEEILQKLGAVTWWEDHDLYMDCENAGKWSVPFEFTGRMRSSVILLGALLARNGKGSLGYPGGCVIGKRPIDMHLFVLRKLGAVVTEEQGVLMAEAPHLQGALVSFSKRSVGATQQGILGAVLAEGETVLENCACEPEIQGAFRCRQTALCQEPISVRQL